MLKIKQRRAEITPLAFFVLIAHLAAALELAHIQLVVEALLF